MESIRNEQNIKRLRGLLGDSKKGIYALFGLTQSAKALFLYSLSSDKKKKLVITETERSAAKLYDEYRSYDKSCRYYPAKDLLFFDADLRSNELTTERIRAIKDLLNPEPVTVFLSADAILGRLPSVNAFYGTGVELNVGDTLIIGELSEKLVSLGYSRCAIVDTPGEFSIRGGIVDIFPLTTSFPFRIELWGDEVDSIRIFDKDTQKSIEMVEHASIFPASEDVLFTADEGTSLLYEFLDEDSCIFLDEPIEIYNAQTVVYEEFIEGMSRRKKTIGGAAREEDPKELMASPEEALLKMSEYNTVAFCSLNSFPGTLKVTETFNINTSPVMSFNSSIPLFREELLKYQKRNEKIVICGQSRTRQKRLYEGLLNDGIKTIYDENMDEPDSPGQILITLSALDHGVEFSDAKIVYISENDIFSGQYKRRVKKAYKKGEAIESFRALSVGDYVVHEHYGIGKYCGIEKITHEKILKDYLKISYAGSDNLYIPVSHLDMLTKYSSKDSNVKLSSLSGAEWSRTKGKVKSALNLVAKDLAKLYALREQEKGYAYGEDTLWQKEFEETFPYEETPGQMAAILDVKKDLMSHKIMDRLICGDVGFGKTEIAIRAAFKVVQENKQVVVLAPTTVLAMQHFNTFSERMKDYPVNIGMLSRFRTNTQNKNTVADLGTGKLDIVIGTHRALSKDVKFFDLGLLIIDEEQRFGVKHKEKIKELKNTVDVLSLTATPIPRTLHMSLIGIRDMSLLDEAPLERLPIQTYVFEQNDEMVRAAISRELKRGGQVYYVINRIRKIEAITENLKKMLPQANIVYAHGQMTETALEDIMADFVSGQIDVLVATTIIEIGLDIPNVNTIVIHDADTLGLSQLYQLRGRVGRSSRSSYAFLMYSKEKMLKDVATKRLSAIKEFSDLGSGFKIAMRDLEIRGAGNLLGKQQHGHMEAVGYDLYCKMLSEALKAEKGEEVMPDFETSVDIAVDANIPAEYIEDEAQKLEIYRRISLVSDGESEEEMIDELIDRFGEPPKSVINLINVARLRNLAHKSFITKIFQSGNHMKIDILKSAKFNPDLIPEFVDRYRGKLRFSLAGGEPAFHLNVNLNNEGKDILKFTETFILDMKTNLT